jgi:ATP-binding cassette subfamily B protein
LSKIREYLISIRYASRIIFAASKKYYVLKLLLSLVSAGLPYIPILLWRELLNALVETISGSIAPSLHRIWLLAILYCAVMLFQNLVDSVSNYISFKYNDAINYYLDNVMIDKVSSIDLAFFDSSDLKDRLDNSWSLIYSVKFMVTFVFDMLQKVIRLAISLMLMMTLSLWLIPIIVLLCIPAIIGDKTKNDMDYQFDKEHAKSHRKLEYYKDLFFNDARSEVRLYHLSNYFASLYKLTWNHWDKAIRAKNMKECIINLVSLVILTVNEIIVYIMSVFKLIAGEIEVGDVAYYVSILTQFRGDFTSLCYRINLFEKNLKELNDVRSFIEMKPLIEKGGTKEPSNNPKIEFNDVSFSYPNSDKEVLSHCSFVINPGEIVGLVGLNGSGKSTIVKLICRFYDPTEGQILIDGIDNKEYDLEKLRAQFGVLFQDHVKYSFSLRENIAMSDLSRIEDTMSVKKACDDSKASDFVNSWEKGIDENLTRRFDKKGKELSGGQWQRIALARAFFRNAPIVLLDEPSAALDPIAEHQIFDDFKRISNNKSAVLISHRLSSITLADRILVLENGHIIEQGSHQELIKMKGKYAYLFALQANKYV